MSTAFPKVLEYYVVNDIELATHGYMISSIERGIPGRKGENFTSGSIHGDQWREKRLTPRTETWTVWICDAHPTTGVVPSTDAGKRAQFNQNYDTVFNLFGRMQELLTIVHYRVDPANPSVYSTRVGYGEVVSSISVGDNSLLNYVEFSVEVSFPDPRWFSPTTVSPGLTATKSSGAAVPITCLAADVGTAPVTYMTITITSTGTLVNPRISNTTYPSSPSVIGFNGSLTSGQSVIINTDALTVTKASVNSISSLYRTGSRQSWFELFPEDNDLSFFSTSGTGTVSITYRKAYF